MMTSIEALALAREIQALPDEYEIAQLLMNLEFEAEQRGIKEITESTIDILRKGTVS